MQHKVTGQRLCCREPGGQPGSAQLCVYIGNSCVLAVLREYYLQLLELITTLASADCCHRLQWVSKSKIVSLVLQVMRSRLSWQLVAVCLLLHCLAQPCTTSPVPGIATLVWQMFTAACSCAGRGARLALAGCRGMSCTMPAGQVCPTCASCMRRLGHVAYAKLLA